MKLLLIAAGLGLSGAAFAQTTVPPGNTAPERDARGIPVVSDPATAPAGFNQPPPPAGTQVTIPANQSAATQPATKDYPACSATVTDGCVQTYERGVN